MAIVLVVDDEPDILLLHRLNLEAAGHEVILAADGTTALERIAERRPDCVVLDVMMPVLDGWGVLERLRAVDSPPPVIVVSAKSMPADVEQAMQLGAKDYVTKPFESDDLIARVEALLPNVR